MSYLMNSKSPKEYDISVDSRIDFEIKVKSKINLVGDFEIKVEIKIDLVVFKNMSEMSVKFVGVVNIVRVKTVSIVPESIMRSMVLIVSVTMRSVTFSVSKMAVLSIVKSMVAVMTKTMSLTVIGIVSIMAIAMIVSMVAIMSETEGKLMWILAIVVKIVMGVMAKIIPVEGVVSIAMAVSVRTFMTKTKVRPMM